MALDPPSDGIRRMFAEIARPYDRMNHLLSMGIDRHWRRRTVRLVPPNGCGPILDVCTGTGDLALAYWRKHGVRVVGADFCHPMLTIGLKKCRKARAERSITLLEADARQLPFPDDLFQIVCVAFGLRNVNNTIEGLREMVRVCRPGGRVAVLDFTLPRSWFLRKLYGLYFHRILPRIGQFLARNSQKAYTYLPASVGRFPQYEALAEQMRAVGLKHVEFHNFTFGVATLYVGEK